VNSSQGGTWLLTVSKPLATQHIWALLLIINTSQRTSCCCRTEMWRSHDGTYAPIAVPAAGTFGLMETKMAQWQGTAPA
jgi:hypothetical protein